MPTSKGRWKELQDVCIRHPYWTLALLTICALVPFIAKPFNIDDPLFVWTARQILKHPGDPYGFSVNWYGASQPMWAVMQNPPLMAYFLAGAACITGWSEMGLHLACLLPAIAAVLGTYRLAKGFCDRPALAALIVLISPGFLVSSTTVMCDVAMLAFWVWSATFWIEGIRESNSRKLALAGALAAFAVLTKYNAVCLVPLLAAFGWLATRKLGRWTMFLLIPLAVLGLSELATYKLYGHPHFLASNQYAQTAHDSTKLGLFPKSSMVLAFMGGSFAFVIFSAFSIWNKKSLFTLLLASVAVTIAATASGLLSSYPWLEKGERLFVLIQFAIWTAGGLGVIALMFQSMRRVQNQETWFLLLWVAGIVVFAVAIYWMVNARVILPLAPAVGILIARRLQELGRTVSPRMVGAILACGFLSMTVVQADHYNAETIRKSAQLVCQRYAGHPGRIWFEGHWGFQYYMDSYGAWPVDSGKKIFLPNDIFIVPISNANTFTPGDDIAKPLDTFTFPNLPGIASMNLSAGAGFYSQHFGPLPFAFGKVMPETIITFILKPENTKPTKVD